MHSASDVITRTGHGAMRLIGGRLKEIAVYLALGAITASGVYLVRTNRSLTEQNRVLARRAVDPRPGLHVPELNATTLDGAPVVLGRLGQRQVLFFFNHTCPYCRASLPAWNAIAARLEAQGGIEVYGVAFDSTAVASDYAAEHRLRFAVIAKPEPRVAGLYRVSRVPLIEVVKDGRMAYVRMGALESPLAIDSVVAAAVERSPAALPGLGRALQTQRHDSGGGIPRLSS